MDQDMTTLEQGEIFDPAVKEEDPGEAICPYFKKDRGRGRLSCEGAIFHFPDTLARREYVYRFCAHPEGYKDCQLKKTMDHFYERKYAHRE